MAVRKSRRRLLPGLEILPNVEMYCKYVVQFEGQEPFISESRFPSIGAAKSFYDRVGTSQLLTLVKLKNTAIKEEVYPS